MSATICPTILAGTSQEYQHQIDRVTSFAGRLHIDLADGMFAPVKTISLEQVWWPGNVRADLHLMYQKPFEHYKTYIDLGPQMVIVHAESAGHFVPFAELMHHHGIEVGVALKPKSPVELIRPALDWIDYVLIFSGKLGHFGGQINLDLLSKAKALRQLKPQLEIGWDGGIDDQNAKTLVLGGIDVLNVGSYLNHAADPLAAYSMLTRAVSDTV
jgi:ribulose-phosphate 3-epimerase